MDKIQSIQDFRKLTAEQKQKLYDNEIARIESYIYDSPWYRSKNKTIKKVIRRHKPWLLYRNVKGLTPVRLFGYVEYEGGISYLVATMDDPAFANEQSSNGTAFANDASQKNELIIGQIQDISRIKPIHWSEIDDQYMLDLIKARHYGGDAIFLKPEMFIMLCDDSQ